MSWRTVNVKPRRVDLGTMSPPQLDLLYCDGCNACYGNPEGWEPRAYDGTREEIETFAVRAWGWAPFDDGTHYCRECLSGPGHRTAMATEEATA